MRKMRKVWIIGYGGFGFQVLSILLSSAKYRERQIDLGGFIDDRSDVIENYNNENENIIKQLGEVKIISDLNEVDLTSDKLVFGVSDPFYKKLFIESNNLDSSHFEPLMPGCKGNFGNFLGKSILHELRLSTNVHIGDYNFFDLNCIIGHDCRIGDYNHIGVNVIVGGNVEIGNGCIIHSGAIIGYGVKIPDNCTIGIGATVVRSLQPNVKIIAPASVKI